MNLHASARMPLVSVVIPVFNDAGRLDMCLRALSRQTLPAERFELIVVDNGSSPSAAELLAMRHTAVHWASEPTPGSYAARNRGIALARGDVIAFTDSDCVPAEDWLETGVAALCSLENCGLVAGRIETFVPNDPNVAELYDSVAAFPQEEYVERLHFGATANVFTTAEVIRSVGPFNTAMKSGGDCEWGQRVHAAGYRQMYSAEARVLHPARPSLRALVDKRRRLAGGACLFDRSGHSTPTATWRRVLLVVGTRIIPFPGHFAFLWRNTRLYRFGERLLLIALQYLLNTVYAFEYVRIVLGGTPRR